MIELWEGQCAVTGAYTLRALVASHAKPWTDSTDVEKLDTSNGLLLACTLDKVYDGYLMSVHPETGELLFSDAIDEAERARLAGGPYAPAQDTHGRTGCLPGGALPALPCEEGGTLLQAAQLAWRSCGFPPGALRGGLVVVRFRVPPEPAAKSHHWPSMAFVRARIKHRRKRDRSD